MVRVLLSDGPVVPDDPALATIDSACCTR